MYHYLIILSVVCSVTAVSLQSIIHLSRRYNLLDQPDGTAKLHTSPVAHFGGVAIFLGSFLGIMLFYQRINAPYALHFWYFIGASFMLLCLGICDDFVRLKPHYKFLGQVIAVIFYNFFSLAPQAGGYSYLFFFFNSVLCLAIINAFNFIDVFDGLTTTVAIPIFLFYAALFCWVGIPLFYSLFLVCLAVSLTVFLLFNFPPASIYMGDTGSLFLGGVAAFSQSLLRFFLHLKADFSFHSIVLYVAIALGALLIPLLELLGLIILRTVQRIPPYLPSKDHFIFYLKHNGWNHLQILGIAFFGTILGSLTSIFLLLTELPFVAICCIYLFYSVGWMVFLRPLPLRLKNRA